MSTASVPPEAVPPYARTDRKRFADYVVEKASDWHRKHMGRLYAEWFGWNDGYFGGELWVPYLLLTETSCPRRYGDYSWVSGFGGFGQTRIRDSLLTGKHPDVEPGDRYAEGRYLFVSDVFLHESVHQWQHEVLKNSEPSYKGHGPLFAGKCNEIGAALGLPPVRPAKARGKNKGLPSCAQWPHNVRPDGYYQGAYVPPEGRRGREDEGEGGEGGNGQPDTAEALLDSLFDVARKLGAHFSDEQLKKLLKWRQAEKWVLPPCDWGKMLLFEAALVACLEERAGIRPAREQPAHPAATVLLPGVSPNGDMKALLTAGGSD
jgi:hypothetical protein